jgi:hypothetical protein
MEVHIKALLELAFPPKPPKFGVKAHIEAPTRVATLHVSIERDVVRASTRRETSGRYLVPPCSDARAQAQPLPFPSPLSLSLSL